jgi:LmbE family N-acetylglucosaminyl deacetylase
MVADALASSPLGAPDQLALLPATAAGAFRSTLVVAPHPDDETLGCGGTIALLRRASCAVSVLVITDGAASHPHSRRFPPARLAALRRAESCAALSVLGVAESQLTFLGLPDAAAPRCGEAGFAHAVAACAALLERERIRTVLAPWRRDPHDDHRAASEIVRAALQPRRDDVRLLEYPIWLWFNAQASDAPQQGEAMAWRLAIKETLPLKRSAIDAYHSQTTDLIDDDPNGFRLRAAEIDRFSLPWELFLEATIR